MNIYNKIIFIVLLTLSFDSYFALAAESETLKATVTDNLGESIDVYNLNLSEWRQCDRYDFYHSCWFPQTDINIKKGASEINLPFENVEYIEYDWSMNPPRIAVRIVGGEIITGQPLETGESWCFRGQTSYGNFKIITNDTKRIEFDSTFLGRDSPINSNPSEINIPETTPEAIENINNGDNNIINNIINNINNYLNNSGNTNYITNNYINFILEIVLFTLLSIAFIKYVPEMLRKRRKSPPQS